MTNAQVIETLKSEGCLFFKENELPSTFTLNLQDATGNGSATGYYGLTMFNSNSFVSGFILNRDTKKVTLHTTDENKYNKEFNA